MLDCERRHCFDYFYQRFSRDEKTYGLMPDAVPCDDGNCSVAACGFMLAGLAVGADFNYISKAEAEEICIKSLKTYKNLTTDHGFYYHFYDMDGGGVSRGSELSLIDSALLFAGALTAGGYFGGEVLKLSREMYLKCDWEYFYCHSAKLFYMGRFARGFSGYWDNYAEQLIVYFLAAGSPKGEKIALEAYNAFERLKGAYMGGKEYIHTWFGSLFAHQFSHAFIDFYGYKDGDGVDWFENSKTATLENRRYCMLNAAKHRGYGENGWGLTSCLTEHGYKGRIGVEPSGNGNAENLSNGTIAPAGALGSVVFTPEESLAALNHFYGIKELVGEYGLYDAYNEGHGWFSKGYISIDKGITLLMAANYEKQTVWRSFCSLTEIKKAYETLNFKKEI